ncbi:MAG: DinB family protein [Anaerolineae bacterium]
MGEARQEDPVEAGSLREEIREELEATRMAYHALLESLPEKDWKKPSGNPAWTVGQLMVHMTFAPRMLPADVGMIRSGGWMPKLPAFLFNWANVLMTRWAARNQSAESVGALYDVAHDRVLALLDTIQDDEWGLGREYPDWDPMLSGMVTIERLFRYLADHYKVHAEQVRQGLAGEAPLSDKE